MFTVWKKKKKRSRKSSYIWFEEEASLVTEGNQNSLQDVHKMSDSSLGMAHLIVAE